VLHDELMSLHTSLKVGGPADLYVIPEDADDLQRLLVWLNERSIPWLTIGRGYNLLVRDKGIRGAVVSLERFCRIEAVPHPHSFDFAQDRGETSTKKQSKEVSSPSASIGDPDLKTRFPITSSGMTNNILNAACYKAGGFIRAEAGAENLAVVRFAQSHGLGGIGFISGIPGTIGGAIKMNAGAYGEGILEHTDHLTLLRGGKVADFRMNELDYGYRHLTLEDGDVVLAATFKLDERDPKITEEEIRKDTELRRTKHNVGFPSAGSFFKNPQGQAAWRLIDAAGMRGTRVGGAQVSPVHSNFLTNIGGATAQDFFDLAAMIKNAVFATSCVTLDEEVRIVGEL
jgi:UDP-N-acetylmuramate dehydrogenase